MAYLSKYSFCNLIFVFKIIGTILYQKFIIIVKILQPLIRLPRRSFYARRSVLWAYDVKAGYIILYFSDRDITKYGHIMYLMILV